MRWLRGLWKLVASGALAAAAGCATTPASGDAGPVAASALDKMGYEAAMREIPVERAERLKRDLEWPAKSEAVRPERVAWTLDHAQWYVEDQANDLARNADGAGRLLDRDLERAEHQLPRDAADWWRMLWANPDERIPRHAVRMFY